MKIIFIACLISLGAFGCVASADAGDGYGDVEEYENELEATVSAWEELIAVVPEYCRNRLGSITVYLVNEIPERCQVRPEPLAGCNIINVDDLGNWDSVIILRCYDSPVKMTKIAIHEYTHVLHWCMERKSDPQHTDRRLWDTYGKETIESRAYELLD